MFKEDLQNKLQTSTPYQRIEVDWLLQNIGNPDPDIRDQLVYASFCHGLLNQLFQLEDFSYLLKVTREQNFLFDQIGQVNQASLTRSFTALLYALILYVDQVEDSIYYQALTDGDRAWLFKAALTYFQEEKDNRGYDSTIGWIHCRAHAAEFLLHASNHKACPQVILDQILPQFISFFQSQTQVFTGGEERRLALVLANLVMSDKLSSQNLLDTLRTLDFPQERACDYFAKLNVDNFLSTLYFQLKTHDKLDDKLEEYLEQYLSKSL